MRRRGFALLLTLGVGTLFAQPAEVRIGEASCAVFTPESNLMPS